MQYHRQTRSETSSLADKDAISILINDNGNGSPFDKILNWDDFKKEYYALEKKIKKSLENLHLIQIEFTKQISLLESHNGVGHKINLYENFKNESTQSKIDLERMSKLFKALRLQDGDHDELIKQNMLKRFKEIHQDHEKEFSRLSSSIELNKKKLELFNETLKLGELNMENPKLSSKTGLLVDQNKGLSHNNSIADQIISSAKHITHSFSDQKNKLIKVSSKLKRVKEEFLQANTILKKIKQHKLKKSVIISVVMILVLLFCFYKLLSIVHLV